MGSEASCRVHQEGRSSEGKAELEGEAVHFRGSFRFKYAFQHIASARVIDDSLLLITPDGETRLELGKPTAEKWLEKILHPKSTLDKLGVKAGMNVAVVGIEDESFLQQLTERMGAVDRKTGKHRDMLLWGVKRRKDLERMTVVEGCIQRDGAIWAIWPKGKPELKEDDIRNAALAAGLVDVKVMKFSETHSGLKLVIPRARR
jgi:hypothetical protein